MIYRIVALLLPLTVCMYRVSQVLPPDRKHTLLIDLQFSKNDCMCIAVEHSVKILIFLMKQVNTSF
jgi:hypothetical protein